MRTRQLDWLDLKTKKVHPSFQVYLQKKWVWLSRDKELVLFKSAAERDRIQALARRAKDTKELADIIEKEIPRSAGL